MVGWHDFFFKKVIRFDFDVTARIYLTYLAEHIIFIIPLFMQMKNI